MRRRLRAAGGSLSRAPKHPTSKWRREVQSRTAHNRPARSPGGAPAQARTEQDAERALARQLWHDEGWVFATPTGGPLNHNTDYHEWQRLLKVAGLREARLHDARHTAATVLLILRQPERTVMSLMGWSSTDMAKRYQHVTDTVRADVASQVCTLIREARTEGAADETVTVRRHSLATILQLVEDGLLTHGDVDNLDLAELQDALADLHTAMATPNNDTNGEAK